MYEAFFGLRSRPFSPLSRVDTYVAVAPLREPLAALTRCIDQEQGIGVVTAPAGTGKSLICRLLYHHFRDIRRTVLLTTARFPTRRALLQAMLFELKHPYVGLSEQEARLRILDLLQASPAPLNRMLLIVDEAHLLSPRGLEELRTLTDYEMDGAPCIALVLSGQLELEELLTQPDMNALNQRVGCHVCIEPLTFEESSHYIRDRLRIAGNDGLAIFTPEAIQLICSASEGNPRRLNQLCDHSLLLAFAEEERLVDESLVRSALLDLRELPLHWNAPLDLSGHSELNPLEEFTEVFADAHTEFLDDPLTECDTDLELEDGSAFDTVDSLEAQAPSSSVFEVGASPEEFPIDHLFQVDKFVVPTEYHDSPETPEQSHWHESPAPEFSHAFETASPHGEDSLDTESSAVLETEPMDGGFVYATEPGGVPDVAQSSVAPELPSLSQFASPLPAVMDPREMDRPMGFEELVVDDVYAAIDRQSDSGTVVQVPRLPTLRYSVSAANPEPAICEEFPPHLSVVEPDEVGDDLDDTLFEDRVGLDVIDLPVEMGMARSSSEPVLLESQLLDFINEISVNVRKFREEKAPGQPEGTPGSISDNQTEGEHRPRHQSLRQSLSWHFDVVEPESVDNNSAESDLHRSIVESHPATAVFSDSPVQASDIPETVANPEATDSPLHGSEGRYAQLFTRLQRQRRRVELVMNHERRAEAETCSK